MDNETIFCLKALLIAGIIMILMVLPEWFDDDDGTGDW